MKVRVLPRARAQARRAEEWWRGSRPAAPSLFQDELASAFKRLAENPGSGRPFPDPEVPSARRLLLAGSRYHVYYLFDPAGREVVILAVWSAVRGRGPVLKPAHK